MLTQILVFLAAALVLVPLFKRAGLGAVLGYLAAGVVIGPQGLALIREVGEILHFSELGIVFLLFLIGLELEPKRLWLLRRTVFGLGGLQVALTSVVLAAAATALGVGPGLAILIGMGLSMSSTAFVMATLEERREMRTATSQGTFGILLFQDLAVIPLLALLPVVTGKVEATSAGLAANVPKALGVVAALVLAGRALVRPAFRFIETSKNHELMTGAALFIVIGTSLLLAEVGLSMSLGAFLAGVVLASSEYRHELAASIEPYKALLLGLFFMAVGMSADLGLIVSRPAALFGTVVGMMVIKFAVLLVVGRLFRYPGHEAFRLGINLSQGGEFAFVLFAMAAGAGALPRDTHELLVMAVTVSVVFSAVLFKVEPRLRRWIEPPEERRAFERIDDGGSPVIIAGFGRFGQVVARLLRAARIRYTALESSSQHVDFVRKFGNKLYYGDASNLDLLRAAKAEDAKILVVAIDDVEASNRTVQVAKRHFPHLKIFARARNRPHMFELLDAGVESISRETFLSSLDLGRQVLMGLGMTEQTAGHVADRFRRYDEETILKQHAGGFHRDSEKMAASAREYNKMLESLMEQDEREAAVLPTT